jgi:hypothetical protein
MNANEMKEKYWSLYEYMANSRNPENMKAFGRVMTAMVEDMIQSSPAKAEEYISRLESIKWKNYLTQNEADRIVSMMEPKAPWTREQWKQVMDQHGYPLEEWPCYNKCALWVTMNMIMSDSSEAISEFIDDENLFEFVYKLAVSKLKDLDGRFLIRQYFSV